MRKGLLALASCLLLAAAPAKKDVARATALVDQAVALFRAERYIGAAELFLEAHAITDLAVQLRNAAKAFELGGDEGRALDAWRKYAARSDLSASERSEAIAEIARIEEKQTSREAIKRADDGRKRAEDEAARAREAEQAAEQRNTKTATVSPPVWTATGTSTPGGPRLTITDTEAPLDGEGSSKGPYYLAGGSAVLAISSAVLWLHAGSRLSDLDRRLTTRDSSEKTIGIDQATARDLLDSINTERGAAGFVLGAGVAALTTGLMWWLLE